jgi:hypothetical protein
VANCCCEAAATRDAVCGPCQPKCSVRYSCHATVANVAADVRSWRGLTWLAMVHAADRLALTCGLAVLQSWMLMLLCG